MIQKQSLQINFASGVQTKTDPWQLAPGQFLDLQNSVFGIGNLLQKRNGFKELTPTPDNLSTTLRTFKDSLIALGSNFLNYSADSNTWINSGSFQPLDLSVLPIVRNSTSQTAIDCAVASNGLACAIYAEAAGNMYQIVDSSTGQIIIPSTAVPSGATNPRVFALGNYFVIGFIQLVTGVPHLRYIAISTTNPTVVTSPVDLSTQVNTINAAWNGTVANNNIYFAWDGSDLGGAVRATFINSALLQGNTYAEAGQMASRISVTADTTTPSPTIWINFWNGSDTKTYASALSSILVPILAPTEVLAATAINQITSVAANGVSTVIVQVTNSYTYAAIRSDFLRKVTITSGGVVGTPSIILRGAGIASSAFSLDKIYLLASFQSTFQPSYFLIDEDGNVVAKLAYSNGNGYYSSQIVPSVTIIDSVAYISYLYRTQLVPVNKTLTANSTDIVYSQMGVNLAKFDFSDIVLISSEIGNNLNITGGIVWAYDNVKPVEQGFNIWPDDILATSSTTGGTMTAQQYSYQVTYEWTDAQGNLHRSAPSIPSSVTTTGATSSVTLDIPTLRLTYKTSNNPVRIVIYRWSVAQQTFYQITSITSPLLNDTSVDSVQYVDTVPDADILGNPILYTTGGIVENIGPPASTVMTLFKSRLFILDSEDRNLLWYSKQVIEATPVEMSDLFTIFVPPTVGAQGSTGDITALAALDDKLIVFKRDALYYIVGTGPDNTGANNDFSEPVFITGTVGCTNQQSIVFMPNGLMFQSDKGIWLLGRDLTTTYIGSPVERYTQGSLVKSALAIPGTNQVRFTMDSGITLMYDYFYGQWGTFTNIPAISSTLYLNLHTQLNSLGQIFQENPGSYLDGSKPVLMSFTTGWFNLAGVQGFQRAYEMYLLGKYISPHKLNVQVAYDYNPSATQQDVITPDNFGPYYGNQPLWGNGSPWGGPSNVEQWRVFFQRQQCQSFQVKITEIFDSTIGVTAGAGLTLSGLDLTVGIKSSRPQLRAVRQVG